MFCLVPLNILTDKFKRFFIGTRGGSEQSEVSEIGTVGNRKWLKSRNSEIGNQNFFSEIGRKKTSELGIPTRL
uniref:Ovule protein n=1 Tax=Meloidogyne incognita TaxID=6306 RepID=A0A914KFE9_MELIC